MDTPLTPATSQPPEAGRPPLTVRGRGSDHEARRARAGELLRELLELGAAYPEFSRPLSAAAGAAHRESERTMDSARDQVLFALEEGPRTRAGVARRAGLSEAEAGRPSTGSRTTTSWRRSGGGSGAAPGPERLSRSTG